MLETNERPGGVPDDNITSLPLSSSETDSAERDDDFRISSLVHFRENLLKILVAVAFSLLIICIIILALLLHERKSGSKQVGQTDKGKS